MGDKFVTLVIYHGGKLIKWNGNKEKSWYWGGALDVVDNQFDLDHLSLVNIKAYAKDLGYINVDKVWTNNKILGEFIELEDDSKVGQIVNNLNHGETLDIYIEGGKEHGEIGDTNDIVGTLSGVEIINDDDDGPILTDDEEEELVEVRKKVREAEKAELEDAKITRKRRGTSDEADIEFEQVDDADKLLGEDQEEKESEDEEVHSEYYDSDEIGEYNSDVDDEADSQLTRRDGKIYFDESANIPQFSLGMVFDNVEQFKMAIYKYAVMKGVGVKFVKNEGVRVKAVCMSPCPWSIYASIERNDNTFMVKTYIPNHKCYRVSRNSMANSKLLASLLQERLTIQPYMKLKDIQLICRSEYKVHVGISTCMRVKQKVNEKILGDYKLQYGLLHDYVHEVLTTNPGSTCMVQSSTENGRNEFLRFYICFRGCKEGWKKGCRPILGLDGCFLKGLSRGQLLCAVGRDGNNQIFPVAWAVVSVENKVNWQWFLRCLKQDLQLEDGEGYTIISDMQKGLLSAMHDELPLVHHRLCARHVFAAWAKKWRGIERKKAFWAIAKSTYKNQLQANMDMLDKLGKGCVQDMLEYPVEAWVKCFFPTHSKCDIVDNNISETFNGWILQARWKPIITMLDEIRKQVMNRLREKKEFAEHSWICDVSPRAMDKIEKNKKYSFNWLMTFNGDDGYEITNIYDYKETHVVNLKSRSCSCRKWDISGLPCQHAICAIHSRKEEPATYVSQWYTKDVYLQAYSCPLNPLRGQNQWTKTEKEAILPPELKPKPGRPKRNRRKDKDKIKKTGKLSRQGRKMTCSQCNQQGHNKKGCKNNSGTSGATIATNAATSTTTKQPRKLDKLPIKRKMSEQSQASHIVPPHKRTILGHETKGLQWKGKKSMTTNQLQHIVQQKKSDKFKKT